MEKGAKCPFQIKMCLAQNRWFVQTEINWKSCAEAYKCERKHMTPQASNNCTGENNPPQLQHSNTSQHCTVYVENELQQEKQHKYKWKIINQNVSAKSLDSNEKKDELSSHSHTNSRTNAKPTQRYSQSLCQTKKDAPCCDSVVQCRQHFHSAVKREQTHVIRL